MRSAYTPKNQMFVHPGNLIASLPEDAQRTWLRASLPAPVRLLWRVIGQRQFLRHRRALAVNA